MQESELNDIVDKFKKLPPKELSLRYYRLWNFSVHNKNFFGMVFDFQKISSLSAAQIEKLNPPLCRLDSPFMDELIHQFTTLMTRVGVPNINPQKEI